MPTVMTDEWKFFRCVKFHGGGNGKKNPAFKWGCGEFSPNSVVDKWNLFRWLVLYGSDNDPKTHI
jgi:hypothetical protein